MNILAVPYGSEHRQAVRLNDTLRVLVKQPSDGEEWSGNVTFRTSFASAATDDVALATYDGEKVQGTAWDLYVDYDTSSIPLVANTRYLVVAELTQGTKKVESITTIYVLPQGR